MAARALWFYPSKLLLPWPLVFFYPKWSLNIGRPENMLAILTAVSLPIAAICSRSRIGRGPATAILFYGGTILPAIGFINIYPFRYSYVADHFQYLASLGILTLLIESLYTFTTGLSRDSTFGLRRATITTTVTAVMCLPVTYQHAHNLSNLETLYRHTLSWNPSSTICHNNLGLILRSRGDLEEALSHFEAALDGSETNTTQAQANIFQTKGEIHCRNGNWAEAVAYCGQAAKISRNFHRAHFYSGLALSRIGDDTAAIEQLLLAIKMGRKTPATYHALANSLESTGRNLDALICYKSAFALGRRTPAVALRIAWLLSSIDVSGVRDGARAIELAGAAHRKSPSIESRYVLAAAFAETGDFSRAIALQQEALTQASREASPESNALKNNLTKFERHEPIRVRVAPRSGGVTSQPQPN